jgi:hypothetical protein
MLRNVASQKYRVFAWDATTGLPKTGDAANISAYITKDDGTPAATNDAAPTEASSTNEKGYYDFDLTQAETNAAKVSLSPQSSTSNVVVVACPPVVYTRAQYDSLTVVSSAGVVSSQLANSVTHGGNAAKLELGSSDTTPAILVSNSGGDAVRFLATGGNGDGFHVEGAGNGAGLHAIGTGLAGSVYFETGSFIVDGAIVANITGNLSGSAGSVTGAVGSVTGNVGGNVTGSVGSVVGAVGSVTGAVGSVTGNVGGNVVGSVGSLTGFTVDGSGLTSIPWNASWDAEVQSEVNDGLVAFWTSPATLVDLVWDELLSGHTVSGSTGEALAAAGTAGDPWTTSLPGSYTGDQAGKILAEILVDTGTTLDGKLDTIDGIVDDILVDTGTTIPGTIATAQNDLDILTGTDGATLAASQPNYAPAKVSDLGTVQTADHTAAIAALPTLSQILAGGDIDGFTLEETLKLCLAALAGKLDGAATTTITIRSADDSANRIVATVDADGNRSAVTLDATG